MLNLGKNIPYAKSYINSRLGVFTDLQTSIEKIFCEGLRRYDGLPITLCNFYDILCIPTLKF